LAALLFRSKTYEDPRIRFLVFWLLIAFVFFSYPQTKLPGYVLPLMPSLAIVLAVALDKAPGIPWWLAGCAVLLIITPIVVLVLPDALFAGISTAHVSFRLGWPFVFVAGGVFWIAWRSMREWAVFATALAAIAAITYIKVAAFPVLDQRDSVRSFWRANSA